VGLVSSQRGLHGGFALVRKASTFSVLDVIAAVEPLHHIRSCPLRIPGHTDLCMLHTTLESALLRMEEVYAATPIDKLLAEQNGILALCDCAREELAPA
jgi:DNA-binding IscR family transcriptional regulator